MNWRLVLGASLLASPFVTMFIYAYIQRGFVQAAIPFVVAFGVIAVIGAGIHFISTSSDKDVTADDEYEGPP